MNSRVPVAFVETMVATKAHIAAERIYVKLQRLGTRQVRFYQGMLLTYPYPAKRGYGTRGLLVGIYTVDTRLEWVLEDVMQVLKGDRHA